MLWITVDGFSGIMYCGLIVEIHQHIYLCLVHRKNRIIFRTVHIYGKSEIKFQDIPEDIRKQLETYMNDPLYELEVQKAISKY